MTTFHDSMWAEASRDHAAEGHERAVALSSVALAGFTPFLLAASSPAEYDQRLALVSDRVTAVLVAHTPDTLAHTAALSQVRADFEAMHTTRVAARLVEGMAKEASPMPGAEWTAGGDGKCSRCPHDDSAHKGEDRACTKCDCDGFEMRMDQSKKNASVKTAGGDGNGTCGTCGQPIAQQDYAWYHLTSQPKGPQAGHDPHPAPHKESSVKTAGQHSDGSGAFKVQVTGVGEYSWSENSLSFDTEEEAKAYAKNLMGRWMGADMARVVPTDTPRGASVEDGDPAVVVNYRTGSRLPFGGEVVTASLEDLIASLSDEDVLEAEAALVQSGTLPEFILDQIEKNKDNPGGDDDVIFDKADKKQAIGPWGRDKPHLTQQERWEQHHADPKQQAKDQAQEERYEDSVAAHTAAAADWPKGDSPMFPGEKIPACPKCGSVDTSVRGVPGSDGRMGGPGGGGETITCNACGHSSRTPAKTAAAPGVPAGTCTSCKGTGVSRDNPDKECPVCDGTGRNTREASLVRTATVTCAKCTTGSTPDGADCGYCDGAGSLDATMAMIKAADGWDQGITAQSFFVAAVSTSEDILRTIRNHDPDGEESDIPDREAAGKAFDKWVKDTYGEQAFTDYHTNWDSSFHEAVNNDAKGTDRYQKTTQPSKAEWISEWSEGEATDKELAEGRAGKDRGLPKGMESTKQASLTKEADLAALTRRVQAYAGKSVNLTYAADFGVTTVHGTLAFADGNASVTSPTGAVTSVPVHRVMSVNGTGYSDADPGAGSGADREPSLMDWLSAPIGHGLVPSGATASRKQANPYASSPYEVSGPGSPNADNVATTPPAPAPEVTPPPVDPKTTRPRVVPQSGGGFDPEAYPTDKGSDRVGPVDRSADTLLVSEEPASPEERTAALDKAHEAFTTPPKHNPREAKIGQIVASVLTTNPGMDVATARSVAEATVARYAGVTGA